MNKLFLTFCLLSAFAMVIDAQSTQPIKRPPSIGTNQTSIEPLPAKKDQQAKDIRHQTENKENIVNPAIQIDILKHTINSDKEEKEKDYKSNPEVVLNWLTGILAFIGILQLIIFTYQSKQLRRSVGNVPI